MNIPIKQGTQQNSSLGSLIINCPMVVVIENIIKIINNYTVTKKDV